MRVCLNKSDDTVIEMQAKAREGTLLQNAINAGYSLDDIVELEISEEQWFSEYKDKVPTSIEYNADAMIVWANNNVMDSIPATVIGPAMAAFIDFANKATPVARVTFESVAAKLGLEDAAAAIIAKAIELGARI